MVVLHMEGQLLGSRHCVCLCLTHTHALQVSSQAPAIACFFLLLGQHPAQAISPPLAVPELWLTEVPDRWCTPEIQQSSSPNSSFFSALCTLFHGVISFYPPSRKGMPSRQLAMALCGCIRSDGLHNGRSCHIAWHLSSPQLSFFITLNSLGLHPPNEVSAFNACLRFCFQGDQG